MDRRRLRTREKGVEKTRARSPRVGGAIDGMPPHGWRRIQAVRGHDKGLKRASALRASGERPPLGPRRPWRGRYSAQRALLNIESVGGQKNRTGELFLCGHAADTKGVAQLCRA